MSNFSDVRLLINQFSGQDNIVVIPRIYVDLMDGDYHMAVFLNQVVYWSDKTSREDGYFYKSYPEWEEELLLSEYQIRKATKKLKELGLIETALKKANGVPTVHYFLHFEALSDAILKKLQNPSVKNPFLKNFRMDSEKTSESLTEITTENSTTTEKPLIMFFEEELMVRLSPMQMQKTFSYVDDFLDGDLVVRHAITMAADKNKRSFAFVEFLLRDWLNNKAENLAAVIAYEKEKFGKQPAGSGGKPRIDFDSFRDDG